MRFNDINSRRSSFVVLRPETRAFIDCVLSDAIEEVSNELPNQDLRLKGSTKIDDLRHSYGLFIQEEDKHMTLDSLLRNTLARQPSAGNSMHIEGLTLAVLETLGRRITTVGLTVQEKPIQ